MADLELVIGARNEAQAVLDEIGDQLRALAIPAQEGSLKIDSALNSVLSKLAYSATAVTGAFGAAVIAVGSIASGTAVKAIYDEAEAIRDLNRELANYVGAGRITEETAKAFAAANRESLGISEKQTISLMTQASSLGVAQGMLDEAALAAIGLSKALGINVKDAMHKVIEGDDRLVSMTDSVNAGLREQGQELEGVAGLWNLMESSAKKAFELLISSTQPIQTMFVKLGTAITEGLTKALIGTISALEVYQNHSSSVNEYVVTQFQLAYEQIKESAKHLLTEVLPAYWEWYLNNAYSLLSDGSKSTMALMSQQSNVVAEIFGNMSAYMSGAIDSDKLKSGLLEAIARPFDELELRAEKMPEVIGQKLTAREAELSEKLKQLGGGLGKAFNDTFKANLKKFEIETPQLKQSDIEALRKPPEEETDSKKSGMRKQEAQAVESRLLIRGRTDQALDRVAQATKDSADRLKSIDENMRLLKDKKQETNLQFGVVGR